MRIWRKNFQGYEENGVDIEKMDHFEKNTFIDEVLAKILGNTLIS